MFRIKFAKFGLARKQGRVRQTRSGFAVMGAAILFMATSPTVAIADGPLVKRLKIMKKCEYCDLSGADLRKIGLARANLTGANLKGANFAGANLSGFNLRSAVLTGANLKGAKLRGADLRGARLDGAILTDTDLEGARLERAWIRKVDMRDANLKRARLDGATLQGSDLRGADIRTARLFKTILRNVNLSGNDYSEVRLNNLDFSGADFSNANLHKTGFVNSKLIGANLAGANLSNVRLDNAQASSANFTGADMTSAVLRRTKLHKADFTGATLFKADLGDAELVGAILVGANLTQANLQRSKMTGATSTDALFVKSNLHGASLVSANLSKADFSNAIMDRINLGAANLHEASLEGASMSGADLRFADLRSSKTAGTRFAGADLRGAKVTKEDLVSADTARAKLDRHLLAALNAERSKGNVGDRRDGVRTEKRDLIPDTIEKPGLSVAIVDVVALPPSSDEKPLARINWLHHAGDGSGRLFAADMRGKIHVIKNGRVLDTPFLDVAAVRGERFLTDHFENGLSSFAFHPDYAKPGRPGFGKFYTVHTETSGPPQGFPPPQLFSSPIQQVLMDDVLTEWSVDQQQPDRIAAETRRELIRIREPHRGHNMGLVAFNPTAKPGSADYGQLYIGIGDGGDTIYSGIVDAQRVAQNRTSPFGAILRINPLSDGQLPYQVPSDNPFIGKPGHLPEIWAYGFRNPLRFSWDAGGEHKMIIADIGQANIEELNLGVAGGNYGWSEREGTFSVDHSDQDFLLPLPPGDSKFQYTYPVAQYDDDEGNAVVGGFVYRGKSIAELRGLYIFGDIVTGRIFYVAAKDLIAGRQARISELTLTYKGQPRTLLEIMSGEERADLRFGMGEDGEIYILTKRDGMIRKLQSMPGLQSNR